jgi:hypothetical protein
MRGHLKGGVFMASTNKGVLLITEKRDSDFSKKVINAAELSKTEVIISSATFQTFSKVLEGKVGVVVLDHDELGGVADHIFRAIRTFHSTTPVLMAYSKKLILEQLIGRVHEGEVSVEDLAKIMVDSIDFDEEITRDLNLSYAVEKEVELYAPLVSVGMPLIVEDTNNHPGPIAAVEEWFIAHEQYGYQYRKDYMCEKFMLTFNRDGYFERMK